jgi:hypothetical protein
MARLPLRVAGPFCVFRCIFPRQRPEKKRLASRDAMCLDIHIGRTDLPNSSEGDTVTSTVSIKIAGRSYTVDIESRKTGTFADVYEVRGNRSAFGGLFVREDGVFVVIGISALERAHSFEIAAALGDHAAAMLAAKREAVAA